MADLSDIDANLARRLRLERETRGWSLAEVAERSGVSKAMISKIERAEVSATAALLVRLSSAFGLTLATLLLRAEEQTNRVSRAAEQPRWMDPETGYIRRQVLAVPNHPVELADIELPARRSVNIPAHTFALIRQLVWVQSGVLTLTEGGERHELHPGDCLAFGAPSDVTFANDTDQPCCYVVALYRQ